VKRVVIVELFERFEAARDKLSKSEKKLSGIIYECGVDDKGFAVMRSKGEQALFGGFSTNEMKRKLNVPDNRPLADFLPTLAIKAKDFSAELTSHDAIDKYLQGQDQISKEHVDNNCYTANAQEPWSYAGKASCA